MTLATLVLPATVVFSKRAALGPPVDADHARRHPGPVRRRRELGAVGRRRDPERAREAGGERPEALEPDREADVRHRAIGRAQKRGGALEASRQQIGVWRFAERPAELTAEVGARESGRPGEVVDVERLEVARVGEVLGTQQVPAGGDKGHETTLLGYCNGTTVYGVCPRVYSR